MASTATTWRCYIVYARCHGLRCQKKGIFFFLFFYNILDKNTSSYNSRKNLLFRTGDLLVGGIRKSCASRTLNIFFLSRICRAFYSFFFLWSSFALSIFGVGEFFFFPFLRFPLGISWMRSTHRSVACFQKIQFAGQVTGILLPSLSLSLFASPMCAPLVQSILQSDTRHNFTST